MARDDRERWDTIWAQRGAPGEPSRVLVDTLGPWLPARGRALDVAGGPGRHALWLASRGLDVTVVDVSEVAVAAARAAGLRGVRRDLESEPLPEGPWDVIVTFHYLQRDLFPTLVEALSEGGVLAVVHPTVRNLERHEKPSARWLLAEGELRGLVPGVDVLAYSEGWTIEDRHEAVLIARKTAGR